MEPQMLVEVELRIQQLEAQFENMRLQLVRLRADLQGIEGSHRFAALVGKYQGPPYTTDKDITGSEYGLPDSTGSTEKKSA